MADYQRILSYLYGYQKKEKKDCKGFIKMEIKRNQLKGTVSISDERWQPGITLALQLYKEQEETVSYKKLGSLTMTEKKEELTLHLPDARAMEIDLSRWDGVILNYQEEIFYASVWKGDALPIQKMNLSQMSKTAAVTMAGPRATSGPTVKAGPAKESLASEPTIAEPAKNIPKKAAKRAPENKKPETAEKKALAKPTMEAASKATPAKPAMKTAGKAEIAEPTMGTEPAKAAAGSTVKEGTAKAAAGSTVEAADNSNQVKISETDDDEKLLQAEEKPCEEKTVHPELAQGRKIRMNQIREVCGENTGLESNAFLRRGYEKHQYLITGIVLYNGKKRRCVGVPGVYENRERYMARQYGFPVFLSLTHNHTKTGSMGYWLHIIEK